MSRRKMRPQHCRRTEEGVTLLELVVVVAILGILASVATPLASITVRRQQELELRDSLRRMRQAIDAYHQDQKKNQIVL